MEGAADWTVVRVVANERTDGAGDENVLPSPPSALAAVPLVPAFDCAASDTAVSPLVDIVGALDLLLVAGGAFPSLEVGRDCLLWAGDCAEEGVAKERLPFPAG